MAEMNVGSVLIAYNARPDVLIFAQVRKIMLCLTHGSLWALVYLSTPFATKSLLLRACITVSHADIDFQRRLSVSQTCGARNREPGQALQCWCEGLLLFSLCEVLPPSVRGLCSAYVIHIMYYMILLVVERWTCCGKICQAVSTRTATFV